MTDYTAHDIHRLDQAYPDALASIDHFANDTTRREHLAHVGPEVFAADLTRELAATFDKGMSLAGWAAVATTRLIEANARLDELNAEVGTARAVRQQRDALDAEVAELTADRDAHALAAEQNASELDMVRTLDRQEIARLNAELDLTSWCRDTARAYRYYEEHDDHTHPSDAAVEWTVRALMAPEGPEALRQIAAQHHMELNPTGTAEWSKNRVAELTAELEQTRATANVRQGQLQQSRKQAATLADEVGRLTAENARLLAVADAAKTWRRDLIASANPLSVALMQAVDALPKGEACDCCYVDGHTRKCGRTADAETDVAPFGYLAVSATCKARIDGTAVTA